MKPLIAIALAGGAFWLYSKITKGAALQSLDVRIADLDVKCAGFLCTQPQLSIGLLTTNPTDTEINLRSVTGNVTVNGQFIGNVTSLNNKPIPGNSQLMYPVSVSLSLGQVLSEAMSIIKGEKGIAANVRFKGTANVEGLNYPIDLGYKIV